eukprot:6492377-Amphidinium_carterae.1
MGEYAGLWGHKRSGQSAIVTVVSAWHTATKTGQRGQHERLCYGEIFRCTWARVYGSNTTKPPPFNASRTPKTEN